MAYRLSSRMETHTEYRGAGSYTKKSEEVKAENQKNTEAKSSCTAFNGEEYKSAKYWEVTKTV